METKAKDCIIRSEAGGIVIEPGATVAGTISVSEPKQAMRFNNNKIDLTYLPPNACKEWAKVFMGGAEKYERDNWKKMWGEDTIQVCMASLLRHVMAIQSGELIDPELGTAHAGNIMWNAAVIIEYMTQQGIINPDVYESPKDYQKRTGYKK